MPKRRQDGPRKPQDGPIGPMMAPKNSKTAQDGPKTPPPNTPNRDSAVEGIREWQQDGSKKLPEAPTKRSGSLQRLPNNPKGSQELPQGWAFANKEDGERFTGNGKHEDEEKETRRKGGGQER